MSDFPTFRAAVARLVQDDRGVLETDDLDFAIGEAVRRFSRVIPRELVADIAGDGGYDYDLPAEYDPRFGSVIRVEYPAGEREPSILDGLDWTLYESPAGKQLRFLADNPAVGETIRVTVPTIHTVDAVSTTVPPVHFDVIHLLAAAIACESLAAFYSNAGDSTLGADSVDHKSQASEYAKRAARFMKLADQIMPIEQGGVAAASGEIAIGEDQGHLTHPTR